MTIMRAATRFWSKVRVGDGCWEWQGALNRAGYGIAWDGKRTVVASRLAWRFVHGAYPDGGVLHHCDNPPCVRPDHLFVGTAFDNSRDMLAKGRSSAGKGRPSIRGANHYVNREGRSMAGEDNPSAKISMKAVEYIRASYAPRGKGGKSGSDLARELGISSHAISKIVTGKNWR